MTGRAVRKSEGCGMPAAFHFYTRAAGAPFFCVPTCTGVAFHAVGVYHNFKLGHSARQKTNEGDRVQVFFLVLTKTECLDTLLTRLLEAGVRGATILESTGMMRVLDQSGDDAPMFGALRQLFNPERRGSKTLMIALEDSQAESVRQLIREVTGGLNQPDTGVLFSLPALYVEGMGGC